MRTAPVGFALVALVSFAGHTPGQPNGPYSSTEGKYTVRFPGVPKVTTKTAETKVGDLTVTIAAYANSDGSNYMVSYTDFPSAPKPQDLKLFFTGVRDGVIGTGKQIGTDKEFEFGPDKLPAREFVVEKGKQRVKFQTILRDNRLYQIAAIGPADFVGGKDATQFFKSFELTNQ